MSFKVGDLVEFDAIVRGMYPQDDTELLLALEVHLYGRVSVHDHWLRRSETGPLAEGEVVTITGKVTGIEGDTVRVRADGNSAVIMVLGADQLRKR